MKLWPRRATADPAADPTARDALSHIVDGLIKGRKATEARAARNAADLAAKAEPPMPTTSNDVVAAVPIDNTAFAEAELARLASGAPLAAPALDATRAFYAAYSSDDIMRRYRSW